MLERSTLMLELERERETVALVYAHPLLQDSSCLSVPIFSLHKFKFPSPCFTSPAHSHREPPLPSHEGRRSSSADSAFPPAPPLPGPLVLLLPTLPHTFSISKVHVLITRTVSFSACYFLSVLLLFLYGTLVHYHMISYIIYGT